jgi:isoquinoline 1-oxidoreductase beta subunit
MRQPANSERREFLKRSTAFGGVALLAFHLPAISRAADDEVIEDFIPNAFIRVSNDNSVTVIVGRSEMGQGILTSLPQIIADEMDADWDTVGYQQSPTHADYNRPGVPIMITGGSRTIRSSYQAMRRAGATARAMLVAAAAQQWNVNAASCVARNSVVYGPSGKKARFSELAARAASIPVPSGVALKDAKEFTLIGKSVKRLDTSAKVAATASFGIDVQVPGMLTAQIERAPAIGATVESFDDSGPLAVPGVNAVVQISSGVVVVAKDYWSAKKGRDKLVVNWGGNGTLLGRSSDGLESVMEDAAKREGLVARNEGDISRAPRPVKKVRASYHLPYLAHACMEPLNCTAWVQDDRVDIWVGSQSQTVAQRNASALTGVPVERVFVHTQFLGGGFGRRAAQDFVVAAVETSKVLGVPVKLVYSREDDMRAGYYRPISYTEIEAGVDAKGVVTGLEAKVVVPSLAEYSGFKAIFRKDGIDRVAVEGLADMPYDIENLHVRWMNYGHGIPIWFWRSVGATHNAFVTETFIDELAHAANRDPLEFRLAMLGHQPRHTAVLKLAAKNAGWGSPLPEGHARGIAVVHCFGGWTAEVAEVSIENGQPRVHRVVCAVDCGRAINPEGVVRQMESSIVYALSAALYGKITFSDGMVEQGNFDDYPVLRMNETPEIEVHVVDSEEVPGGAGEPGTPTAAPAVANALFALTGERIHSLPLSDYEFG